mmetsp:Transcript_36068/g.92949  ORF Transcript_36068/g.92949 Transcript_36068/m.92949 type:complete len:959 (-) Transcript_36068:85-2961(-)
MLSADVVEEEEDESGQDLVAIEIGFEDPLSAQPCSKVVYGDINEWKGGLQPRFLISSELINLLNEAQQTRNTLFTTNRKILTNCRSGYLAALYKLREMVVRIVEMLPVEDQANLTLRSVNGDFLPVHFYYPEIYWDIQTEEGYHVGLARFKDAIRKEIARIYEEIHLLGGSTGWYALLKQYVGLPDSKIPIAGAWFMEKGEPNDQERREIVEKFLPGVLDKYNALEPQVEALEGELQDRDMRQKMVTEMIENFKMQIPDFNEQLQDLRARLAEVYVPPRVVRKPPKVETDAERAARRDACFALFGGEARDVKARNDELRALLAEWEAKLAGISTERIAELEQMAKDAEKQALVGRKRIEKLLDRARKYEEQRRKAQDDYREVLKIHKQLTGILANSPPPNPLTLKLIRMRREIKNLIKDTKKVRGDLIIPIEKVKGLRYGLKHLYKKLGWDWDFSDSEDENEDKPYWMRRKLAKDSLLPFDVGVFNFEEKDFHKRRLNKTRVREKTNQENTVTSQIAAKRWAAAGISDCDTNAGLSISTFLGEESTVLPFCEEDSIESALRSVRRRLIIDRDELELPKWVHDTAAMEARCRRAVQLQELRGLLEAQLRQCAACFLDQLPAEGALGDLRERLSEVLDGLHAIPVDSSTWENTDQEGELEAACREIQAMIEEAIHVSGEVQPISLALQHAVEFGELLSRLEQVRESQYDMRSDVRAIVGKGFLMRAQARIMSVRRDDFEEPRSASPKMATPGYSSPRLRTQMGGTPLDRSTQGGMAPRLDVLSEPLMTAKTGTRNRRREVTGEVVDFGFRPDGGGEESLENWPLFKVSRGGPLPTGSLNGTGTNQSQDTSRRTSRKSAPRQSDKKVQRYQKLVGDCDFREYMAQQQAAASPDMWKSSSAPNLLAKKAQGIRLPELVRPAAPDEDCMPELQGGGRELALTRDRSAGALRLAAVGGVGVSRW